MPLSMRIKFEVKRSLETVRKDLKMGTGRFNINYLNFGYKLVM